MFTDAYNYMSMQMKKRIGEPPEGVVFPIWAWHSWDGQRKRPDVRRHDFRSFLCYNSTFLMEIEIPDEQVLLSDKYQWNAVVSKYICSDYEINLKNVDEKVEDEIIKKSDQEIDWLESLPETQRNEIIHKSWEKAFDVFPLQKSPCYSTQWIQATFWELRIDQVVKTWGFKSRPIPSYMF